MRINPSPPHAYASLPRVIDLAEFLQRNRTSTPADGSRLPLPARRGLARGARRTHLYRRIHRRSVMSMLDWNGYRQQVLAGVAALGSSARTP